MNNSFRIGSVFGITIRVHWLFLPLVWFFLVLVDDALDGLIMAGSLFLFVFLHELGHSLVAQRFGIRVLDITFGLLGGMARMSEIPEVPRIEGLIAIAGPAVNFALAILFAGLHATFTGDTPLGLGSMHQISDETSLFAVFALINLLLGALNLIPAFPMDGGRLLRAGLATRYDWLEATERAVKVGRVLTVVMLFAAVLIPRLLCILPLIAAFVWIAGGRELIVTRMRHATRAGGAAGADNPLEELLRTFARAAGAAGSTGTRGAAGPGAPFEPEHDGTRLTGTQQAAPAPRPEGAPNQGFSDADVERLERFRGRLDRHGEPPA